VRERERGEVNVGSEKDLEKHPRVLTSSGRGNGGGARQLG
jgi:hypothetical protein